MRITIASETYAPQVNGVSRTLGQLVRVLEAAGDEVQVIHPNYGGVTPPRHVTAPSLRLPFYRELYLPIPPFLRISRAIDDFRPQIIHVATEATLGWSVLRHGKHLGIPVVSSFHTNFDQYAGHYGMGWSQRVLGRYLRWFHNQTRETYVPSRSTIASLELQGFERLVLWPRGVESQVFRPSRPGRMQVRAALGFRPDEVVIGHVSRIAAEKNVGFLGEALAEVARCRPEVRILIVGDGPARRELEDRLGPAARFVGYQWGAALADHYAAADLFAFASRTETFGNVVLEAMSSGLPVVAIRAGGPGEFVRDGETGLLTEPEDPPIVFARAVLRLVDDPALRQSMAKAARDHALGQSWDAIMLGLRQRYEGIVGSVGPIAATA